MANSSTSASRRFSAPGLIARAELNNDTGHTLVDTPEPASGLLTVGDLGTLVDGVERPEVEQLDAGAMAPTMPESIASWFSVREA